MFSRGRLIAVLLVAMMIVGFVFFRGPTPHITIKPETIFSAGGISFTNTMITSWLVVGSMIIGLFLATRKWDLVPSGAQNVLEAVVEALYGIIVNVAGEKNGRRFFPVAATIFFFVLVTNLTSLLPMFNVIGVVQEEEHGFVMESASIGGLDIAYVGLSGPGQLSGETIDEEDPDAHAQFLEAEENGKTVGELLPLFRGANTDINTPLALAIVSMIAVEFWGISTLGFFKYGKKFLNFSSPIAFFVGMLELISETVRLLSFTARLFGNMFAGEVVILMFTFMTPLVLTVVFYGLEIFVGVIQAFIFCMLTVVFGVMAVTAHDEHDDHESEAQPHGEATKLEA